MTSSNVAKLVWLVVVFMATVGAPKARAAVTCGLVVRSLTPCLSYISNGGAMQPQCCTGVRGLYNAAQSKPDRQEVCRCIKSAINGVKYSGFNLGNAASIPKKCSLNVPYKIDPSTNCDRVQ